MGTSLSWMWKIAKLYFIYSRKHNWIIEIVQMYTSQLKQKNPRIKSEWAANLRGVLKSYHVTVQFLCEFLFSRGIVTSHSCSWQCFVSETDLLGEFMHCCSKENYRHYVEFTGYSDMITFSNGPVFPERSYCSFSGSAVQLNRQSYHRLAFFEYHVEKATVASDIPSNLRNLLKYTV